MNIRLLRLVSIFYLLLPNLLFYVFWTNQLISIVAGVSFASIAYFEIRDTRFSPDSILKTGELIKIILCASILCLLSGVCGFAYQAFDYWAHNTKFFELFKHDWPIRIPSTGPAIGYYYGYYVVPALFSKFTGHLCEGAIFVWTTLGISLGICWLYISLGRKLRYALLVLTFGDLAHVCVSVLAKTGFTPYRFGDFGIEVWSNFENLFWVPNQLIPSLLIGGMLVYCLTERIDVERMVFPVVLSFWWAVFPAITSSVLLGIILLKKWIKSGFPNRNFVNTVLLPCLLAIPVLLLFISHERQAVAGFVWNFSGGFNGRMIEYLLNIVLNVAISASVFAFLSKRKPLSTPVFPYYAVLGMMLLLPVFRIGKVNDFLFRGLMPLLIVAGFYVYQFLPALDSGSNMIKKRAKVVLLVLLILNVSLAATRVMRAIQINRLSAQLLPGSIAFRPVPYDTYPNVYEALQAKWSQAEADQYLGKAGSLYEIFIAPK
ncbi:hypothetical protein SAMN05216327_102442 [Dyadobacter sp. SG02]|uniref:hypothetical protein n=1 Tax=Dyadobacter sp. SG02 TaxID=1855291 RepID=UPI0008C159F8|nr:hypothetical protein [Dyadobacter sp. SG02]SEI55771.1 hypothetical protein SAMN05216327_102442 [Dyadobacter sp. SG02]